MHERIMKAWDEGELSDVECLMRLMPSIYSATRETSHCLDRVIAHMDKKEREQADKDNPFLIR